MSKKGIASKFLVWMILGVMMFFVTGNIFASMISIPSRSAEDLDILFDRINQLSHGSSRSVILHHMVKNQDYLVFMDKAGPIDIELYRNKRRMDSREPNKKITLTPNYDFCQEGTGCVCIFKNADLNQDATGVVTPSSSICRPLPEELSVRASLGGHIFTSFTEDDLQVIHQQAEDPSVLEDIMTGLGGAGAAGTATVGAIALKFGIGAVVGAASIVALPVVATAGAVGGIMAVGISRSANNILGSSSYEGIQIARDNYEIDDPNFVIYLNSNEDVRFLELYLHREGDYLITCPFTDYCRNLALYYSASRSGQTATDDNQEAQILQ